MIRGIENSLLEKWGITQKPPKNFFPVFNVYRQYIGTIVESPCASIKYDKKTIADKDVYVGGFMFGDILLPKLFYGRPLVVVEGVWDCLTLLQEGILCVAALTNELNNEKINKILRYTNKIVLWMDSDGPGERGASLTVKRFKNYKDLEYRVFTSNLAKDCNDLLNDNRDDFKSEINRLKIEMEEMR